VQEEVEEDLRLSAVLPLEVDDLFYGLGSEVVDLVVPWFIFSSCDRVLVILQLVPETAIIVSRIDMAKEELRQHVDGVLDLEDPSVSHGFRIHVVELLLFKHSLVVIS